MGQETLSKDRLPKPLAVRYLVLPRVPVIELLHPCIFLVPRAQHWVPSRQVFISLVANLCHDNLRVASCAFESPKTVNVHLCRADTLFLTI